ncbi:MAG: hypothetical protein PHR77_04405, partial [Kiritimatiellae bacterium]|nr:hypothetical protein [Kiritimatiellia bacterium]
RKGLLHYDGLVLSGNGHYGCFAVLNEINMGFMNPAGGTEGKNIWAKNITITLTPEAIAKLDRRNVLSILNPNHDCFKIRRFWLELELADGRKVSSDIAAVTFTQPPEWPYAEGILVPQDNKIEVDLWFNL